MDTCSTLGDALDSIVAILTYDDVFQAIARSLAKVYDYDETWNERVCKDLSLDYGDAPAEPIRIVWRETDTPAVTLDEQEVIEAYFNIYQDIVRCHGYEVQPGTPIVEQLMDMFEQHFAEHSNRLGILWGY